MTGPEHYAEAERLLREGREAIALDDQQVADRYARAQIHATLAVAASHWPGTAIELQRGRS
jgi:hypothetical protein